MISAIEMIVNERARQVTQEGFTFEHDDEHVFGEIAGAAAAYADSAARTIGQGFPYTGPPPVNTWRWEGTAWKPSADPIRDLVKAGALIVAEIERLQRAKGGDDGE